MRACGGGARRSEKRGEERRGEERRGEDQRGRMLAELAPTGVSAASVTHCARNPNPAGPEKNRPDRLVGPRGGEESGGQDRTEQDRRRKERIGRKRRGE